MRITTPAPVFFVCFGFAAILAPARVGETQEEFERRLLQPSMGKFIPRERNPDPAREQETMRQQPFNAARAYFPEGLRERRYWKSAVPNTLSNDNGWRVYVFYQDNRSVFEAYQRVGDTLNEFEIQNILRANQGASEWQRVEPDSLEAKASIIGCDQRLADDSLRARVVGNWLLVYSSKFDNQIKEQLRQASENKTIQNEERLRIQQLTAPASTAGF